MHLGVIQAEWYTHHLKSMKLPFKVAEKRPPTICQETEKQSGRLGKNQSDAAREKTVSRMRHLANRWDPDLDFWCRKCCDLGSVAGDLL